MQLSYSLVWNLVIAMLPALAWLAYFLHRDRYEPEPRSLVALAFFLGMVMVPVARVIELAGEHLVEPALPASWAAPLMLLAIVAPVEELLKYAVVRLRFFGDPEFNEPVDGIVYATSVGIGFATLESAAYMVRMGSRVIVLRSVASTLVHLGCAGLVGYALGHRKFGPGHVNLVPRMLFGAIAIHGLFDVVLSIGMRDLPTAWYLAVLAVLVILLLGLFSRLDYSIEVSLRHSPFRPKKKKKPAAPGPVPGDG